MTDKDPLPPRIERIRARAEELWRQAGCPPGRDNDFWLQAEQEIDAEDKAS